MPDTPKKQTHTAKATLQKKGKDDHWEVKILRTTTGSKDRVTTIKIKKIADTPDPTTLNPIPVPASGTFDVVVTIFPSREKVFFRWTIVPGFFAVVAVGDLFDLPSVETDVTITVAIPDDTMWPRDSDALFAVELLRDDNVVVDSASGFKLHKPAR
jgi:hypothetical protein